MRSWENILSKVIDWRNLPTVLMPCEPTLLLDPLLIGFTMFLDVVGTAMNWWCNAGTRIRQRGHCSQSCVPRLRAFSWKLLPTSSSALSPILWLLGIAKTLPHFLYLHNCEYFLLFFWYAGKRVRLSLYQSLVKLVIHMWQIQRWKNSQVWPHPLPHPPRMLQ